MQPFFCNHRHKLVGLQLLLDERNNNMQTTNITNINKIERSLEIRFNEFSENLGR